jgi:toxin ParE1/3/4
VVKVRWTEQARADLIDIFEQVASDNSIAARKLLQQLRESEGLLLEHPLLGRVVPEFEVANIRERIVPPYRVIYQVLPDLVLFLAVVHSRRNLAAREWR